MNDITNKEQFMGLSRAERAASYGGLSPELKKEVRRESEKRRGIAFRTADGDIIFSRDALKGQILRIAEKKASLAAREAGLAARLVELKNQAKEVYGDDFVAEVETALDAK